MSRCVDAGPRIRLFIEKLFLKEIPCLSSAVVSGPLKPLLQSNRLMILPSAIFSVGTAGGLVSNSRIRDVVVASETVFKDQPHNILKCSEELVRTAAEACSSEGLRFCVARVATSPKAIINSKERHQLHELTGGSCCGHGESCRRSGGCENRGALQRYQSNFG